MREEYRDIKGFEGLYQVSNKGNVKSLERKAWNGRGYRIVPEKILKGVDNGNGYFFVGLWKNNKERYYYIHRLVGQAFLENPNNLPCINHKDENPKNNCVQNLEWCDSSYNNTYNGRAKKVAEKKSKPVFSVNKVSGLIMWWQSAREAERCTGIDHSAIIKCCKGKQKSAGGFYWMYAEEEN